MSAIKLYGYIPNPIYDDVFYVLKETQKSPTLFSYEGKIGYGSYEEEIINVPDTFFIDEKTRSPIQEKNINGIVYNKEYPIAYYPSDMRELKFTYNTETNKVVLDTYWRYEICEEESNTILKNVEIEVIDDDTNNYSYPYIRFPRSKDGISISRLFNFIFAGKDITIFLPKNIK
jgi:hypothetical protein